MFCSSEIINCNGVQCGQGIYAGGGKYVCLHNNLEILHPQIAQEWDYVKNPLSPDKFSPGSNKKMDWICSDPIKNWCGCHKWPAVICIRVGTPNRKGTGCPYCNNTKACPHNSLKFFYPVICEEWDYEKNLLGPDEYLPGSNKKVDWTCKDKINNWCGCHKWPAIINDRICNTSGCPFCNHKKVCPHNSLNFLHPKLCEEWDYERNPIGPDQYLPGSHEEVWWICRNNACGCHRWKTTINNRVCGGRSGNGSGCHYCTRQKVCPHDNLQIRYPKLCGEWDPSNAYSPDTYSYASSAIAKWICKSDPSHKWKATIANRVCRESDCPHCSVNRGYSKGQIRWMNLLMLVDNVKIQYALSPEGEFQIPIGKNGKLSKVDGYCRETNTIYEYHGDYWHGNPSIYAAGDMNPSIYKTYGELYQKTIERENKIRSLGYNLVVKWETQDTIEITLSF